MCFLRLFRDEYSVDSKTTTPQVKERIYSFCDGKIEIIFQTSEAGYTTSSRNILNKGSACFDLQECENTNDTIDKLLFYEKTAIASAKDQHQISLNYILKRNHDEEVRFLPMSEKTESVKTQIGSHYIEINEDTKVEERRKNDYLSPYMVFVKDPSNITEEEGKQIIHVYLKAAKERFQERANIIQSRLHEETEKLSALQASYQQSNGRSIRLDDFERECSELNFRIKVLEKRLLDHEETSVEKYKVG